ncbi:MAG: hypothetical protein EXR86_10230 [Gammaproteobacteria bacterium]|nr:hypothetical protein [Gammaproteobacteria bacterium]
MNEYRVRILEGATEREQLVLAETALEVQEQFSVDAEIIEIKFLRAVSFSCRQRGGVTRR